MAHTSASSVLPVPMLVTGAGAGGRLVLRNYGLGQGRGQALIAALKAMPSVGLKLLDLSSNQLSDSAGKQLLDAISDKHGLELLDLRANLLGARHPAPSPTPQRRQRQHESLHSPSG